MIRPAIGDLLSVRANDRYYYALLLSKVRLFGAPLVFVFHRTSTELLSANELVRNGAPGFHEFVDFIQANREGRLARVATKVDVRPFDTVRFFKSTATTTGKAELWFIYDHDFNELRRTKRLTAEEKRFPLFHRIDDALMCGLVDRRWTPEMDERI